MHHVWQQGNFAGSVLATQWKDMQQGLDWIRGQYTAQCDHLFQLSRGRVAVCGRCTLDLNDASHVGNQYTPPNSINLGSAIEKNRAFGSLYVYTCYRDDGTPALNYIEQHPAQFDLQWESRDGVVRLYKVNS